ncbi:polyprenol monophosphomannose synthase [Pelodictyon luteolum]|uniref:Dolichyl-phosphate beta-D-mannosyltransferase n=1 Tax=Chlorobium luteolum (strain DSM 273 / BCRC 81028 / 2530) TaxID=319225 RepID=Q3B1G5_CHLL3|nr:polyprenol monophosphomannose synthase [Pelodictyon luteolum]ABB24816.1 Dolichyl-phosphate beta-D-mannosyltransferase [Pelodictyon luteolum DSM 273]
MNEQEIGGAGYASALVIIPTYNESQNIGRLIDTLQKSFGRLLDILVIDDSSPDGTASIVAEMQQHCRGLHLIKRERKLGLGTAYIQGFRYALEGGYRFILEMDADFSHDPAMVGVLIDAAGTADLVIGSRYVGNRVNVVNWPLSRLILSKMASIYTRVITGMPVADPTGGFKCFRREVLEAIDLDRIASQGYSFQIEVNFRVWKKGFRIQEVPIVFTDRTVGLSKMTRGNIREAVWMVWWLKLKSLVGML